MGNEEQFYRILIGSPGEWRRWWQFQESESEVSEQNEERLQCVLCEIKQILEWKKIPTDLERPFRS